MATQAWRIICGFSTLSKLFNEQKAFFLWKLFTVTASLISLCLVDKIRLKSKWIKDIKDLKFRSIECPWIRVTYIFPIKSKQCWAAGDVGNMWCSYANFTVKYFFMNLDQGSLVESMKARSLLFNYFIPAPCQKRHQPVDASNWMFDKLPSSNDSSRLKSFPFEAA